MSDLFPAWMLWALGSAGFAALTAVFAKIGVQAINSDFATLLRTIAIAAVLFAMVLVRGGAQPLSTLSSRTVTALLLSGLATGASWLCYFRALKLGDAARVAPVDKLSVVLVAIFGVVVLGERLSGTNWLGVALIAAGAICVAYRG